MVVAVNQREPFLAASCDERRFHTLLGCGAGDCWIQIILLAITDNAAIVPTNVERW